MPVTALDRRSVLVVIDVQRGLAGYPTDTTAAILALVRR
jgi:hypothetical protein